MKPIRIDRCACDDCLFTTMAEVAQTNGIRTVADLQEHVQFGRNCKLCVPYVNEMLRTGETVFHRIILRSPDEDEG